MTSQLPRIALSLGLGALFSCCAGGHETPVDDDDATGPADDDDTTEEEEEQAQDSLTLDDGEALGCEDERGGYSGWGSSTMNDWTVCGQSDDLGWTGREVVFALVPRHSGTAILSLDGLEADLDLFLLDHTNLAYADCIGTSTNSGSNPESIQFEAQSNRTYYVAVDGWDGATSGFDLAFDGTCGDPSTVGCSDSRHDSVAEGVDHAHDIGLDTVTVCSGTYYETDPISIWKDMSLIGESTGSRPTIYGTTEGYAVEFTGVEDGDHFTMRNLKIVDRGDASMIAVVHYGHGFSVLLQDLELDGAGGGSGITTPYLAALSGPQAPIEVQMYDVSLTDYVHAIYVFQPAIEISGSGVEFTDGHGTAISLSAFGNIEATPSIHLSDLTVTDAVSEEGHSVLYAGSPCDVRFSSCRIEDNHSATPGNIAGSGALYLFDEGAAVTLIGCTVHDNVSDYDQRGGGAHIYEGTLTSSSSDWGTGADDNSPFDVSTGYGQSYSFGTEDFVCTGSGCEN